MAMWLCKSGICHFQAEGQRRNHIPSPATELQKYVLRWYPHLPAFLSDYVEQSPHRPTEDMLYE